MSYLDFALREIPKFSGSYLINLSGAIDAATAIEFQTYLENLKKRGAKHFLFDMNSVTFINSTGLGLLVNLADELKNHNGSFGIINIHSKLRVVFNTLGLDYYFDIFNNLPEGLQYIARKLPVDKQISFIDAAQEILQKTPEKKSAEITEKTIPSPVIALSVEIQEQKVSATSRVKPAKERTETLPELKRAGSAETKQKAGVTSSQVQQKPGMTRQYVPPPQPLYAPPPVQIPAINSNIRGTTRIIGKPAKQKAAYILISPNIPNFGLIYTHVQGACVSVNVIATRIDPNDPNFLEKAQQMISRVNFVIADFSYLDDFVLQQASYSRFQVKPPKPLLGIIQGSTKSLPPQWQKTSFIMYQMSNEGLSRLKVMLQQTISKAITKL